MFDKHEITLKRKVAIGKYDEMCKWIRIKF